MSSQTVDFENDIRDLTSAVLRLLYVVEETMPRQVTTHVSSSLFDSWAAVRRVQERHMHAGERLYPDRGERGESAP